MAESKKEFIKKNKNLKSVKRKSDLLKRPQDKSLLKDEKLFRSEKNQQGIHEGKIPRRRRDMTGSIGQFFKESQKSERKKYYLALRKDLNEYIAVEILNLIDITTPKVVIINRRDKDLITAYTLASQTFEEYMPMGALLGETEIPRRFFNSEYQELLKGKKNFVTDELLSDENALKSLEKESNPTIRQRDAIRTFKLLINKPLELEKERALFSRYQNTSAAKLKYGSIFYDKNHPINDIIDRYQLDPKTQMIYDNEKKTAYKISGNAFSSDLAAMLIQDDDFQVEGDNCGFVPMGNRFYFVTIDKAEASFKKGDFEKLTSLTDRSTRKKIKENQLYEKATLDQKLHMVRNIYNLYYSNVIQDMYEKPYLQELVKWTEKFQSETDPTFQFDVNTFNHGQILANLQENASQIISHYQNYLYDYDQREQIRSQIIGLALEKCEGLIQDLPKEVQEQIKNDLRDHFVEDLRGVYYQYLFVDQKNLLINEEDINNGKLIQQLINDISQEIKFYLANKKEIPQISEKATSLSDILKEKLQTFKEEEKPTEGEKYNK